MGCEISRLPQIRAIDDLAGLGLPHGLNGLYTIKVQD
jgi:hypothetical protein